jgi:hypothetical protein
MRRRVVVAATAAACLLVGPVAAQEGKVTLTCKAPFSQVAEALEKAVSDQKLALVCHLDAQRGAVAVTAR